MLPFILPANNQAPRVQIGTNKQKDDKCVYQLRFYDGYPNDLMSYLDACKSKLLHSKNWDYFDENMTKKDPQEVSAATKALVIIKKCNFLKSTSLYKDCLDQNYQCHMYANDKDLLKQCRAKKGITVPKIIKKTHTTAHTRRA